MHAAELSDAFWMASLAINLIIIVVLKRDISDLYVMEKLYLAVNYLMPLALSSTLLLSFDKSGGSIIGDTCLWCWIKRERPDLRLGTIFAPIWCIFIGQVFAFIISGIKLYQLEKEVAASTNALTVHTYQILNFIRVALRYLVAFFLHWFFPTLNRLREMIYPDSNCRYLYRIQAIFAPSGGTILFLLFVSNNWDIIFREKWDQKTFVIDEEEYLRRTKKKRAHQLGFDGDDDDLFGSFKSDKLASPNNMREMKQQRQILRKTLQLRDPETGLPLPSKKTTLAEYLKEEYLGGLVHYQEDIEEAEHDTNQPSNPFIKDFPTRINVLDTDDMISSGIIRDPRQVYPTATTSVSASGATTVILPPPVPSRTPSPIHPRHSKYHHQQLQQQQHHRFSQSSSRPTSPIVYEDPMQQQQIMPEPIMLHHENVYHEPELVTPVSEDVYLEHTYSVDSAPSIPYLHPQELQHQLTTLHTPQPMHVDPAAVAATAAMFYPDETTPTTFSISSSNASSHLSSCTSVSTLTLSSSNGSGGINHGEIFPVPTEQRRPSFYDQVSYTDDEEY